MPTKSTKPVVKYLKGPDIETAREYSVVEVAALAGMSRDTITRYALAHPSGLHRIPGRGAKGILRIPGHVLQAWLREWTT
jgi:hypothetical protein